MTKTRRSRLGIGALMIGIPASAAALTGGQALAADFVAPPATTSAPTSTTSAPTSNALQIDVRSRHIHYGRDVVVRGTAPLSDAGHTVALEFARAGSAGWQQLGTTTVGSAGGFRLARPLERSGLVRVLDVSGGSFTPLLAGGSASGGAAASSSQPIEVAAQVRTSGARISALDGQPVQVRGRVLPGHAGRRVSLQDLQRGHWQTLARARTSARGAFALRYVANDTGQELIRVRFAGDSLNSGSTSRAGQLTVYREAEASWYDDGGNTACGFHAYYGVANRDLPCGTQVDFRYNGRSVTATVDDRGPYVGGRDWDLNQNTASALGFGGVGAVWSSQ